MTRQYRRGGANGSVYVRVRVKPELRDAAYAAALRSGLSMSYYLELLMKQAQLPDGTMPTLEPSTDTDDEELPIDVAA